MQQNPMLLALAALKALSYKEAQCHSSHKIKRPASISSSHAVMQCCTTCLSVKTNKPQVTQQCASQDTIVIRKKYSLTVCQHLTHRPTYACYPSERLAIVAGGHGLQHGSIRRTHGSLPHYYKVASVRRESQDQKAGPAPACF